MICRIGHDNSGLTGAAWCLDRVEIDCPSLGRKWYFPCGRWLAKGKDDGAIERELYPQDMATEEYDKCNYHDHFTLVLQYFLF